MRETGEYRGLPKIALAFFRWFCDEEIVEDVGGDLEEYFQSRTERLGRTWATLLLVRDVLLLFRPGIIKPARRHQKSNNYDMLKHFLTLSLRSFNKSRSTLAINLFGLSVGLTATLLIFLWSNDEWNVDRFHAHDANLYQVLGNHDVAGAIHTIKETSGLLAPLLETSIPELRYVLPSTNAQWFGKHILSREDIRTKAFGQFVGSDFFNVFSYGLIHGSRDHVLQDKNAIVLSEDLAIRLFGTTEGIVGESVEWTLHDINRTFIISGVHQNIPNKSTARFDFVISFELYEEILGDGIHWGNYNTITYLVTEEQSDLASVNSKIAALFAERSNEKEVELFLSPYSDQYLRGQYTNGIQSGGRIEYIRLLSVVAAIILLIACINFVNLSTALASRRLKEVGVKKALGASKRMMIWQYLSESMLLTIFSMAIALILTFLFLPTFNAITGKELSLLLDQRLITAIVVIVALTGVFAGSYPAIYLSGFNPILMLKGHIKTSRGEVWVRKGLVVFQFCLSVVLIIAVSVIYKQIDFLQSTNLGYDRTHIMTVPNEGKIIENIDLYLTQVNNMPGVTMASASMHSLLQSGSYTTGITWPGKDPEERIKFEKMNVYYGLIETIGAEIISGRSFSKDFADEEAKLIFNETAIREMGLEEPVGKTVNLWGKDHQIIGVVKDFHFESLHERISPMFFRIDPSYLPTTMIRVQGGKEDDVLESVEALYAELNPGFDFEYSFLDAEYQALYESETQVSTLSRYFAGLAISISCLGLFGLAAFTSERRRKEIGIRKILGSSAENIFRLLSQDYFKIVALAVMIGLPLSFLLATAWLDNFAQKIVLEWWIFATGGLSAILIALLTVAVQTFKAARANPVHSLRSE